MLWIHRAERSDALVDGLVEVLVDSPPDPFVPEIVAVPTRGIERWITQRLASRLGARSGSDGVCANVDFPFPRRVVADLLATVDATAGADDPWAPERLMWSVLQVVDAAREEPWLALVHSHLGGGDGAHEPRRLATATHIAGLFDRYALHRPAMILDWAGGGHGDGRGGDLAPEARWQAELWRRVRATLGRPSPAEQTRDGVALLRTRRTAVGEPTRLSVFGLTSLPAGHLDVLAAAAEQRDVHLFTLQPSLIGAARVDSSDPVANPLLRSWATDSRTLARHLADLGARVVDRPLPPSEPRTLLDRLQSDIREDRSPAGKGPEGEDDPRWVLDPSDRSVRIHACHGRARQAEVVHDAIGHLMASDPTLEPRDVIILCPDIDDFAPLLDATFGAAAATAAPGSSTDRRGVPVLPYRLADRSSRHTNPLLGTMAALVELLDGRFGVSEVVELAGREPVRRRFDFDDADLEALQGWAQDAGIRWGLDRTGRERFWLGDLDAGTWQQGLDRLLLGVTMEEDRPRSFGGTVPLDDVDAGQVDLAGRIAEFVDRLGHVAASARTEAPIAEWTDRLATMADLLFLTTAGQSWQRTQLDEFLEEIRVDSRAGDGGSTTLALAELRALIGDRLRAVPTRTEFRTGAVTMCTLVPMRAVPHRVVCIVGLDDGAFPRSHRPDGDDLLATGPAPGDRDPRTEDRQLLLDAVMSATQHLVVTYRARDERTNAPLPPAVPLAELLDVIDRTAVAGDGTSARAAVTVAHPLQPFDPKLFQAGAGAPDAAQAPWSFDRDQLAAATLVSSSDHRWGQTGTAPPRFLDAPVPDAVRDEIPVDELVRFVQHPAREFLRQRLGLVVWEGGDQEPEVVPVEVDGLGRWSLGQRILDRLIAGADADQVLASEALRGGLPPGPTGERILRSVTTTARAIHRIAVGAGLDGPTTSVEVHVLDPDGSVTGTVPGQRGDRLLTATYSKISPRHRLAAFVRLAAVTATHPERPWTAVTIGRDRGQALVHEVPAFGSDPATRSRAAQDALATVVDLWRRGMREPLPLPVATGCAWAAARNRGRRPEPDARKAWESGFQHDGEDRDPSHRRVHGGTPTFDLLLAEVPRPDEAGPGWDESEGTRLGRLAVRLWAPVLTRESFR